MERLDFCTRCADYLIGNILPMFIPGGFQEKFASLFRWAKGGAKWAIALKIDDVIARRESMLRFFGIVGIDGSISIDALKAFLDKAFEEEAELVLPFSVLGFECDATLKLNAEDKEKLMEVLNG